MKGINVLHGDRLPKSGAVVVPARLDAAEQAVLEQEFQGRKVVRFGPADLAGSPALEAVRTTVAEGGLALFLPEPAEAWPGEATDVPREVLEAIIALGLPLVPVAVDRPDATHLSSEEGAAVTMSFGTVTEPSLPAYQESLLEAGVEAFSARPSLNQSLALTVLRGLKKHGQASTVVDGTDESTLTYEQVLAVALAVSRIVRKEVAQKYVGVVLPPGKAGLIANLAILLAGKIPVNLNFTAGKAAIESAMRQAGIERIVTVDLVVRKMQEFPWPSTRKLILLERLMPTLKLKARLWGVAARLLPPGVLLKVLGLPAQGGDAEAALLFTSGSSGEPKGVVLTHRNIISNVIQFGSRLGLGPEDKVLGCLPLFHSFGFTVTLWYPLIEGIGLVTYPSPMEVPKLAGLIEKYGISLVVTTPTFLRGYLRKAKPEQLAPVKLLVTGAEKLPSSVAESFKATFGKDVYEGYGLTETAPATNVNLPTRIPPADGRPVRPSHRPGSVGQLLPGIAVRITDAVTGEKLPLNRQGIIWFKGPNVFPGYYQQPRKTEEVLRDGWFRTGDLGRLDEDGFLYIEGRLSRFSKIGGEMVPHETVEEHINRALGLENEGERKIAVVGIPDPEKGEALVLLSTVAGETIKQELIQLRYALLERGVPSLWIPKKMLRVSAIPVLASGKLDLRQCEELAKTPD